MDAEPREYRQLIMMFIFNRPLLGLDSRMSPGRVGCALFECGSWSAGRQNERIVDVEGYINIVKRLFLFLSMNSFKDNKSVYTFYACIARVLICDKGFHSFQCYCNNRNEYVGLEFVEL